MATRTLGNTKLPPQLEKIKKTVKKAGMAIAKRISEVTAATKPAKVRAETKGRRAATRTKAAAKRTVKTVARKAKPARK